MNTKLFKAINTINIINRLEYWANTDQRIHQIWNLMFNKHYELLNILEVGAGVYEE
jgi:hypothetical protein